MKQRFFWILLFGSLPFLTVAKEIFESSLATAKHRAATEGKLIMLDFTAKWCAPCQFMEEHTFSDSRVNNYFKASFVPVQVDIDDFDGYAIKQNYEVTVLPTIIILNSKGEFVARYEESMAPSRLLEIMESHDTPSNKVITIVEEPVVPPIADTPTPQPPVVSPPPTTTPSAPTPSTPVEQPYVNTSPSQPNPPTPTVPDTPIYEPQPEQPVNEPDEPLASGSGLFKFTVEVQPSTGYSVQIGAFYQYENVLIQVSQLQQVYDYIIVNANRLNGNPVYKILLGHFDTADEARFFAKQLEASGMSGSFIVPLETLM